MTSLANRDITCPICEHNFVGHIMTSTNNFGGTTTDFHSIPVGADSLHYIISTCPQCGFTDYTYNYGGDFTVNDDLRDFMKREVTPLLQSQMPTALKYELAGILREFIQSAPLFTADTFLRAAWMATDKAKEKHYRENAIIYFKQGLDSGSVPPQEVVTITYLIGELYRRIGEQEFATTWFNRAIQAGESIGDEKALKMVEHAKQQRDDPQEMFKN